MYIMPNIFVNISIKKKKLEEFKPGILTVCLTLEITAKDTKLKFWGIIN